MKNGWIGDTPNWIKTGELEMVKLEKHWRNGWIGNGFAASQQKCWIWTSEKHLGQNIQDFFMGPFGNVQTINRKHCHQICWICGFVLAFETFFFLSFWGLPPGYIPPQKRGGRAFRDKLWPNMFKEFCPEWARYVNFNWSLLDCWYDSHSLGGNLSLLWDWCIFWVFRGCKNRGCDFLLKILYDVTSNPF